MALKYFVEAGAIVVRRVRKEDMRHVAKATAVSTVADMEGEETFDPSFLGYADEVVEKRIDDDDVIMIKGTKTISEVSLILRGANDFMLDEMDWALHYPLSKELWNLIHNFPSMGIFLEVVATWNKDERANS